MKFRDLKDAHLFLSEINRIDLMCEVKDSTWSPSDDLLNEYVKTRRSIVPHLKDFRKSQSSKENWRKNRFKMKRAIKSWHRSTDGKKFHRSLGRYLATRISKSSRNKDHKDHNDYESKYEALKGLSSLRTHLYIDSSYYKPLEEQIDFDLFMEELVPVTLTEELRVYRDEELPVEQDLDILCRAINLEDLIKEFCLEIGKEYSEEMLKNFDSEDKSYIEILEEL